MKKKLSNFPFVEVVCVLVVLILLGVAILFIHNHYKKTTHTANTQPAVATNVWIGKGANTDWSTASNWSLGVPKNGQDLDIDVTVPHAPTDPFSSITVATLHDDLPKLVVHTLLFEGADKQSTHTIAIEGDPLTVTDGIDDAVTWGTVPGVPTVSLYNDLNFEGSTTVYLTTAAGIMDIGNGPASSKAGTYLTVNKGSSVNFINGGVSQIQISIGDHLKGSGTFTFSGDTILQSEGTATFNNPQYTGKFTVSQGTVYVFASANTLGSAHVTVMNGGSLSLTYATKTATLTNPMTLSGNGVVDSNGKYEGALLACINLDTGSSGCAKNAQIILSGPVTLGANTELGGTSNFMLKKLISGSYKLSTVPGSTVKIKSAK